MQILLLGLYEATIWAGMQGLSNNMSLQNLFCKNTGFPTQTLKFSDMAG